jgi:hypothetical protein
MQNRFLSDGVHTTRVLYAGDVCGITLGDGAAVVCGGTVTTLGACVVGWQGW